MIRSIVLLLLCLGLAGVMAPFVLSALLIDEKGVPLTGHVSAKDERVIMRYGRWQQPLEITVQYAPPHGASVGYLKAQVPAARFDQLRTGDAVALRYLRPEDSPHVPGAAALRSMQLLPTVHLREQTVWGNAAAVLAPISWSLKIAFGCLIALMLWRFLRIPFFAWAVACCVLAALVMATVADMPKRVVPPSGETAAARATVKSVERIQWLLRTNRDRGFRANQPVQVVGVEFVPGGRIEPVVAVDLVDEGPLSGLHEGQTVWVDYQRTAPRRAAIRGATRTFFRRNWIGIGTDLVACVLVAVGLWGIGKLIGRGYRGLVNRSRAVG